MSKVNKAQRKSIKLAESRERERKALELRKAAMTYQQIANALDVDTSTAHRLVKRALDRITDEPAEDLRKVMDERLNTMLMVSWPGVQAGEGNAIDRAMRIMDRQAALRGLNAPKEIAIHGTQTHVVELGGDTEDYRESLRAYRDQSIADGGLKALPIQEAEVVPSDDDVVIDVDATDVDS